MNKIAIAVIAALPLVAQAECYLRSQVVDNVRGSLHSVSDIREWKSPAKCIVTFKAQTAEGKWYNGSGEFAFTASLSEEQACNNALEQGKKDLLQLLYGNKISSQATMVCDETPLPSGKLVQIGEVVKLSDVTPHPKKIKPFTYMNAECRWFIENSMIGKDQFHQFEGIICKAGRQYADTWQVLDKF